MLPISLQTPNVYTILTLFLHLYVTIFIMSHKIYDSEL